MSTSPVAIAFALGSAPVPNLVDALLYSLAEDRGEQAIGVVLSGGGSDGTVGIGAIKEAGGFGPAQHARRYRRWGTVGEAWAVFVPAE